MIRNYRQSDLALLAGWGDTAVSPTILHAMLERSYRNWVFVEERQPVGYALVLPVPGLTGLYELHGAVAPSRRRQGLGSQQLERVLLDLRNTAVKQLSYATTNLTTPASQFLLKNQFVIEHVEWGLSCSLATFEPEQGEAIQQIISMTTLGPHQVAHQLPALYDRCFKGLAWYQPYSADEIQATFQEDDHVYLLTEGDETVGFAWLHHPEPKKAEIEPIGIVPERQGRGYGRFFLNEILQRQKGEGKTAVSLGVWESNQSAISLYQSVGFKKYSETTYLQRDV